MTDREKLIALMEDAYYCSIEELADHLLASGVVVRKKGEWEIIRDDYDNELMRCPACREEFYDGENDTVDHTPNFCPNCGADMRKVEN
jgi:hypothetical protein